LDAITYKNKINSQESKKTITCDNNIISYSISGNDYASSAIVFLNGFYNSKASWVKQQRNPYLKKNYKLLFFDYRGFGDSFFIKPHTYDIYDLVNDVLIILDTENISDVTLCGYSAGGIISLVFAHYNSEMCRNLILLNTSTELSLIMQHLLKNTVNLLDKQVAFEDIYSFLYPWFYSEHYYEKIIRNQKFFQKGNLVSYSNQAIKLFIDAVFNNDLKIEILTSDIKIPLLLIGSMKDKIFPISGMKKLAKKAKNAELHILSNSGHASYIEKYKEINQIIQNFLE